MAVSKRVAVILAGGSGTRFWPASRADLPKQYLALFGKRSLIQQTADRLSKVVKPRDLFVCSSTAQKKILQRQLPKAGRILEPAARNTAPAVLLSALELRKKGYPPSTLMAVFPADHYIADTAAFQTTLETAFMAAEQTEGLVTLGIVPRSAHTGYGYIEAGTAGSHWIKVTQFVEKPEKARADQFVKTGRHYWNSGIFIWSLKAVLEAFEMYAPEMVALLSGAKAQAAIEKAYRKIEPAPVDKAILEKARNVFMVPANMGWSDVGSWNALYEMREKDSKNNTLTADKAHLQDTKGCLIYAPGCRVAAMGVQDLVIVMEGDTLLVCPRALDQTVRDAAKELDR